ncbi:MAG: hypothetical protein GF330_14040 [Candidatus Eisenbacteria bacterium]|nr:hypothetical protein [Candidatus Eisenbacteria bacterium]
MHPEEVLRIRPNASRAVLFVALSALLLLTAAPLAAPAGAATLRVTLEFAPPEIVDAGEGAVTVEATDCVTFNEPGLPLLPARKAVVLLPPGEEVAAVRVVTEGSHALDGTYAVAHAETPRPISAEGPFPPTAPDPAVYGSDAAYPPEAARLITEQLAWGHGLAFLRVYPVAYRPASGELTWYERVTIEVETSPKAGADPQRIPLLRRNDRALGRLEELALNPQDLVLYTGAGPADPADSRLDPDYYPYVIVTPQQFADAFQEVADFQSTRGLRAIVVTTEQIAADYPGYEDLQESIRYFLIDAYANWQTEYVLLGGDHDVVPERDLYVNAGGTTDRFPGDCYFEGLDGTWNDDGDSRWGEPGEADLVGEIAVGRASIGNNSELTNWFHKSQMYTEQPVVAEIQKALFVGEQLDWMTYGGDSMDDIRSSSNACNYSTTGYDNSYDRERLYERDGSWDKWDLINLMNDGVATTHHLGHSNTTYCMKLENSDVQYFTNDGVNHTYMFNYSQGCYSGDFDNGSTDCIVETMVNDNNASAAFIANSRYGWYIRGSECGPSQHYEREFVDARLGESFTTAGWMNVDSKADCVWQIGDWLRWCHYELCLFGDPAMPQWHEVNGTLALTHTGTFEIGQGDYQVTVTSGGSPISGATVTVYSDDFTIWDSAETNGSGVVQLDPAPESPMTLYLKTIKTDYLPATDDLEVVAGGPCELTLTSPNGGESFCPGDAVTILWDQSGSCGAHVSLELLQGGSVCLTIDAGAANDGSYIWTAEQCGGHTDDYAVRVTDLDSGTYDDSDGAFEIQDACTITVSAPNGGESFLVGEEVQIGWSHGTCCSDQVSIELLRDGESCLTIASSTSNDGAYTWSADQCGGETGGYAIRVTDLDTSASDESDGDFEIWEPCDVSLTYPNGGESFCPEDQVSITWDADGACGADVRLELLHDGEVCATIAAETANDGSYDWLATQCGSFEEGYAIRVTDLESAAADDSDDPFTIHPACSVALLTPNGGESFLVGEDVSISWSHSDCCGADVSLELLRNGEVCATIASSTPNDGQHTWIAARCDSATAGYAIRVTDLDSAASDDSDGAFEIWPPCEVTVTAPNGGAAFCSGEEIDILWDSSGACGSEVAIDLLRDGEVCAVITVSTPNDGSYAWSAEQCDDFEEGYAIRVTDLDSGARDASDAAFTIYPSCQLAVESPNGGELYLIGEEVTIRWSSSECCSDLVDIDLLRDGEECLAIAVGTENDGSFAWVAEQCQEATGGYAIRVTDLDSAASDESDGTFEIWPPCEVQVLSPNGGEAFTIDEDVTITWDAPGVCGMTVEIALLHEGTECQMIASGTENDGTFTWTAAPCETHVDGYRIRVRDLDSGAADESDGAFSIRPHYFITGITDVPEDQGGEVLLGWLRCWSDGGGDSSVTGYEIYRRQDRLREEGWDLVGSIAASGDSLYECAAPTVCDSTAGGGICWSVFFVRAVTEDPQTFHDTPPDSGYSVDNLAPAAPENFHLESQELLMWNANLEEDLDFYTVYGSDAPYLDEDAVTIGTTTDTTLAIPEHYPYFHCTATDVAGNEGEEATVSASGVSGGELRPTCFALYQNSPNPARPATSIAFDLPREAHVRLRVYDLAGRLVATLASGTYPPGRHAVSLAGEASRQLLGGAYFYRLDAEEFSETRKMLVIR